MTKPLANCDSCYNFGIVSTKLNSLIGGLAVVVPALLGLLGWVGISLYDINGKMSTMHDLDDRVHRIEKEVLSGDELREANNKTAERYVDRLGCDVQIN